MSKEKMLVFWEQLCYNRTMIVGMPCRRSGLTVKCAKKTADVRLSPENKAECFETENEIRGGRKDEFTGGKTRKEHGETDD